MQRGRLTLSDEEARLLQTATAASQRKWGEVLKENLTSDEGPEQARRCSGV
jgi:hypothetical protein